jgi:endonuclease III related protein
MLARPTGETNVEHVLTSLRRARLRSPRALARIEEGRLATVIRAAGAARADARRLKAFARWLVREHGGRFDGLRRQPLSSLRTSLLAVPGLGPETADAILLYAAHRPVFVADALTRRALAVHGVLRAPATYEHARRLVEAHLPSDPALFRSFHALLVAAGQARRTLKRRRR